MRDFIFDAHAIWQYVALLSVVVALVLSFLAAMSSDSKMLVYRLAGAAVGIQVLLGVALWIADEGWSLGFMQGWLHPIVGIAAVGVINVFVGRARKTEPSEADRVVRTGLIIAVVLVVAAIGIGEMA